MELSYEVAVLEQREELLQFCYDHFITREPSSLALDLSREDAAPFFEYMVDAALKSPVSIVVLNKDRKIVGCRLSMLWDLPEIRKHGFPETPACYTDRYNDKATIFNKYVERLDEGFPEMVPINKCQKCLKFILVCVHPDYYRQNIAGRSVAESIERGKAFGCDVAVVEPVTVKSQGLFEKLGFSVLKVIKHEDFLDQEGNRVFTCKDGTDHGRLMFKLI